MPLYKVQFEGEVVIYTEGETPGEYEVRDAIREEISGMGGGVDGLCVYSPERVTAKTFLGEWAQSRPYEREDDMTCAQILAAEAEAEKRRPPTAAEIEAAGQVRLIP
jgi:hypothetical protein